jgi:hypothetical protein
MHRVVVITTALALALAACSTGEPRRPDDAGAGPGPADAGGAAAVERGEAPPVPVVADAGAPEVPVVAEEVDAGHVGDRPSTGPSTGPSLPPTGPSLPSTGPVLPDPIQVTIWNRLIVKTAARDVAPEEVGREVERITGQKVEKVRRTAGTFWLVQLAPVQPPRLKADQQKLVEQLKASGSFAIVEGDQIMTVK